MTHTCMEETVYEVRLWVESLHAYLLAESPSPSH
ncbi:mCG140533 [Mus musculus]|nr:mCG140533 [Mus musculus]